MRRLALMLLLAGCASGPEAAFDAGFDVHVIVLAARPARIQPTCTLGRTVEHSPVRRVSDRRGVEVAILRVPKGEHRFSFFDPMTHAQARATVDVQGERWIAVTLSKTDPVVYEDPPYEDIGPWVSLVAVGD